MTRIRYKKVLEENNVFISTRSFFVNNTTEYKVRISLSTNSFQLFNVQTNSIDFFDGGASFSNLKIKAKKKLIEMGATFTAEHRVKGITLLAS